MASPSWCLVSAPSLIRTPVPGFRVHPGPCGAVRPVFPSDPSWVTTPQGQARAWPSSPLSCLNVAQGTGSPQDQSSCPAGPRSSGSAWHSSSRCCQWRGTEGHRGGPRPALRLRGWHCLLRAGRAGVTAADGTMGSGAAPSRAWGARPPSRRGGSVPRPHIQQVPEETLPSCECQPRGDK